MTTFRPCANQDDALHRAALSAIIIVDREGVGNAPMLERDRERLAFAASEAVRFGAPEWVGAAALAIARGEGYVAPADKVGYVAELYRHAMAEHDLSLRVGATRTREPRMLP